MEQDFLDEIILVFIILVVVWGVNVVTKIFVWKLVMPSGVNYEQLSGWNFSNIRVVGLVCRKSGKEAGRNPN